MAAPTRSNDVSSVETTGTTLVALPTMWRTFVIVCLVFSVIGATRFVIEFPGFFLLLIALLKVAGLIGLFLWTTLRDSLAPEDISPSGTSRSTLQRRLLLISGMLLINIALIPILPEYELWWLLIYPMVAAGLALPLIPASIVIGGLTSLSIACAWFFGEGFQPILLTQAVLALGAVIIRMMTVTNIELERSRDDVARLAVAEERLRFARDLHDSLGHSLSTIVLKSELGGRIIERDAERARTEIQDVERVARETLNDVRAVVTGYRQPTLAGEIDAARQALAAANVECVVVNETDQLPAEIESVLAWGIREGVTNIIRHSDARHCTIRIIRENGTARLELIDDGRSQASEPFQQTSGSGLTGLAERVATAGGWLSAETRPEGGFQLVLEAPATSEGGMSK